MDYLFGLRGEHPPLPFAEYDSSSAININRAYFVLLYKTNLRKKDILDKLDDATTELMTGEGDSVMLMLGDSFMECEEEFATEFCEQQQEVSSTHARVSLHLSVCVRARACV